MTALAFFLGVIAFLLFGLATDQHHGKRFRRPCPKRRATALRILAWTCLAVDFALALLAWGAVFGPIGWCATIMVGAATSFCGLNLLPTRKGAGRQP
jgi:hypothetical protein